MRTNAIPDVFLKAEQLKTTASLESNALKPWIPGVWVEKNGWRGRIYQLTDSDTIH